jgi:hypothetical protein
MKIEKRKMKKGNKKESKNVVVAVQAEVILKLQTRVRVNLKGRQI